MKYYQRKRYDPVWPYLLGTAVLVALTVWFWSLMIRELSRPVANYTPDQVTVSTSTPTPAAEPEKLVEPVICPIEKAPAYTEEDLEILALIIYQEAGGDACSDETRQMVGTVVLNRVASPYFPDTIKDVALQRAQYGLLYWTGIKWPDRAELPQEAHAVARAYECAEQLLEGDRALPADVVYQAEFTQGTEVVAEVDGIYFCR